MTGDTRVPSPVVAALVAAALLFGLVAHGYGFRLGDEIALSGFSALEAMAAHADPDAFARDFPGGARLTTGASPLVHAYFFAHETLGLDPLLLIYVFIVLEMAVLAWGAWCLWQALEGGRPETGIAFAWLLTMLLVGDLQRPNLANLGFPFFHGQFYGYADGLRLAGIAMLLRRRWWPAAACFAACFAIHPIKALMAMAFAAPLLALDWRSVLAPRALAALAATLGACAAWYALALPGGVAGVGVADFLDYTRALQSHWYPVALGFLGPYHATFLSPFLAIVLTCATALGQTDWRPVLRWRIGLGLAVLLLLTGLGLWISEAVDSPALIRLSLVRASTLVTLLAPFVILAGALGAMRAGRKWLACALLVFLVAGFFGRVGLAPAFAVLVALTAFRRTPGGIALAVAALVVVGISAGLALAHPRTPQPLEAAGPVFVAALAVFAAAWVLSRYSPGLARPRLATAAVPLACLVGGAWWTADKLRRAGRDAELAAAYRATQLWAKAETAPGSLFAVDPCRWYGWRDFSGRASIGTVREWYMTAWIYTDRADLLEEGRRISAALGFDMEPFRGRPRQYRAMCEAARAAYYRDDMAGQKALALGFGVNYFVFEKAYAGDVLSGRRPAFENAHFSVLSAEEIDR